MQTSSSPRWIRWSSTHQAGTVGRGLHKMMTVVSSVQEGRVPREHGRSEAGRTIRSPEGLRKASPSPTGNQVQRAIAPTSHRPPAPKSEWSAGRPPTPEEAVDRHLVPAPKDEHSADLAPVPKDERSTDLAPAPESRPSDGAETATPVPLRRAAPKNRIPQLCNQPKLDTQQYRSPQIGPVREKDTSNKGRGEPSRPLRRTNDPRNR